MKQLKNLLELFARLPLVRIIKNALFGAFGIAPSLGVVAQIGLQSWIVISAFDFQVVRSCIVIALLCWSHFFVGVLVALQEVECLSKRPRIRGEIQFMLRTLFLSVVIGGGLSALILEYASQRLTPLSIADYCYVVMCSSVAALTVHVVFLVVPYSLTRRLRDLEADDQNDR